MVRRVVLAILCGMTVCFAVTPQATSGQSSPTGTPTPTATATPSPTPTPTATTPPPSGRHLLRLTRAATKRMGTYHEVRRSVDRESMGERVVYATVADVSERYDREHSFYTVTRFRPHKKPVISRSEEISAGHLSASREPGRSWDCIDWNKLPKNGAVAVLVVREGAGPPLHHIVDLGPDTVHGVPVWHVHATASQNQVEAGSHYRLQESLDYYIAQSDYTTRRLVTSAVYRLDKVTTHFTSHTDYSLYGYNFHIRLPQACKRFHGPLENINPSPAKLLAQAIRAADRRNVHIEMRYVATQRGKSRMVLTWHIDRLAHHRGEHVVTITRTTHLDRRPADTTTRREERIQIGYHLEERDPRGWACGTAGSLAGTVTQPFKLPRSARNVGLTFVGNAVVWHVHARYPNRAGSAKLTRSIDAYISEAHHRFVRFVLRTVDSSISPPIRETTTANYSRYGERLHLKLPRCHK